MNQLGKYQLVAEIARGGMGIVYLAVAHGPARFSKLLVIKELKPDLVDDPGFLEMFLEEARLAARLSHPNIVQTYEIGAEGKRYFMVMDYLDGVTLARVVRKKSASFTLPMHIRVLCDMLQGLHYAHSLKDFDGTPLGIVHRDVTPQNVFITFDGQAKLVDFGIAKAFDSTVETRTGMLKGKPGYMAPEQLAGDIDPRADVFAAGVMLWEAIAGRRMWHKKGDIEILSSMFRGEFPSLEEEVPDAPSELVRICNKAMAKDRDERYMNAIVLRNDLEAYLKMSNTDVTMREVAVIVARLFEEERATTRATIENHISQLKAGKEHEKIPSLRPPAAESLATPSGPQTEMQRTSSSGPHTPVGTPAGAEVPMNQMMIGVDVEPPPDRRRALVVPVILASITVALVAAAAFVAGSSSRRGPQNSEQLAIAATSPAGATASDPSSDSVETPTVKTGDDRKNDPRSGAVKPALPVQVPPVHIPPRPQPVTPVHTTAKDPTPNAPATGDVKPPDSAEATASKGVGYLTLDSYPWAHVSIGGKALGDTPLVHVTLPAGTHVISLDNPNENLHQTTVVTIKPGESVSRRLAF